MKRSSLQFAAIIVLLVVPILAQTAGEAPRAVRRDVPLTNSIARAYAAGTRDASGKPGPNYWQLQTDYTINARLDPSKQTITGTESIVLHNNSPQALSSIALRLDHNIFRAQAPHAAPWVPAEVTDGMVVTKLEVNGQAIPPATAGARGPGERRRPVLLGSIRRWRSSRWRLRLHRKHRPLSTLHGARNYPEVPTAETTA